MKQTNLIEVKFLVDLTNPAQYSAFQQMVQAATTGEDSISQDKKVFQEHQQQVAENKTQAKVEEATEVEETTEVEDEGTTGQDEYTIEEVRAEVTKAAKIDRDATKAALSELGAKNVTKLDPAHYATLMSKLDAIIVPF